MSEQEGFFQLTNTKDHPTNNLYKVYFFHQKERADYFEKILIGKEISYEKGEEEQAVSGRLFYLYGIKKNLAEQADEANYLVNAHFREPFLGRNKWKYLLSVLVIGIIVLAIVSAVMNG